MTEALCGLIENIKKEEKESKKIVSLQEHPGKKKKRHCVPGRQTQEFQLQARCFLDKAGINVLDFA